MSGKLLSDNLVLSTDNVNWPQERVTKADILSVKANGGIMSCVWFLYRNVELDYW